MFWCWFFRFNAFSVCFVPNLFPKFQREFFVSIVLRFRCYLPVNFIRAFAAWLCRPPKIKVKTFVRPSPSSRGYSFIDLTLCDLPPKQKCRDPEGLNDCFSRLMDHDGNLGKVAFFLCHRAPTPLAIISSTKKNSPSCPKANRNPAAPPPNPVPKNPAKAWWSGPATKWNRFSSLPGSHLLDNDRSRSILLPRKYLKK